MEDVRQDEDKTLEELFDEATQDDVSGSEETEEEIPTQEDDNGEKEEVQEEEEEVTSSEEDQDDTTEDDPALILQRYKTLQGMFRSQKEKIEELQRKLEELTTSPQQQKEEPQQEDEEPEPPPVDTSWVSQALDNNEKVKQLSEEFPEVKDLINASLESVMGEYTRSMAEAFQLLLKKIDEKIAPLMETVKKTSTNERLNAIKQAHPDYDEVVSSPEFEGWIESKPPTFREAYKNILESGTPEDVIELLNEYKKIFKQEPQKKPKTVPKTKQKPITSNPPVDMDDFEKAFYEALKT